MKLPGNTVLSPAKFREYLLKRLPENDKSQFLAIAGYSIENWERLVSDIRVQILPHDATLCRQTEFGEIYEIRGTLSGPNGKRLGVVSVWMVESESQASKFITLYPDKEN